jgi:hypothetical protein
MLETTFSVRCQNTRACKDANPLQEILLLFIMAAVGTRAPARLHVGMGVGIGLGRLE